VSTAVAVAYIDAHRDRFEVEPICRVLANAGVQIAPSSYYAAKARPPSARSISDVATTAVIDKVHVDNYVVYGVSKIHAELRWQGYRGLGARCAS
jgi:putative transposase